jgi:Tfp pilus assembly protein PilF
MAGDEESQMACLERSVRHHPKNKMVYINLAKLYVKRGRIDESDEMLLKGLISDSPTADSLTDLGIYAIRLRSDYREGLDYFLRAIAADSSYTDAYLNAGIACSALGRNFEMRTHFTKYLHLEPESPKRKEIEQLLAGSE